MKSMKIVILNGSPKGMLSVTMQYMKYLELRYPNHQYEYINAAQSFKKYERNIDAFNEVMAKISEADLILWAYPLYFLLVCSQYKRFIELVFERNRASVFEGKYSAALSTSIHFFDNTALNYIHAVSDDLNMKFLDGITAKMDDLKNPVFQKDFDLIFTEWIKAIENRQSYTKNFTPVKYSTAEFIPQIQPAFLMKTGKFSENILKVSIVGDLEGENSNIRKMAEQAALEFGLSNIEPAIIDLGKLKFGPCTGCLKCGFDNICEYDGKDEFINIHRHTILESDIIVFAGEIHDRYLSAKWQRYLDRSFNKTHKLTLKDKQIGFLISGPLSQNYNIRTVLQAYAEVNMGNIAGFISDESGNNDEISDTISAMTEKLRSRVLKSFIKPTSFLGVGGQKVFRDDIFSHLRFVFQADHKFFKEHGLYDFPQRKLKQRMMTSAAIIATKIPPLKRKIRQQLRQGMVSSYKGVLKKVEANKY